MKLKIGDFARIGQVTVQTLRHYDDLGILKPSQVDPLSGYRYYTLDQLPRLHQILTLKDLGFSLEQIAHLLDENLPPAELHGMLRLKRTELRRQVDEDLDRLERLEARLRLIEGEGEQTMHKTLAPSSKNNIPGSESSPSSWAGTLAGCAAFLLFGGFSILQFSRPDRPDYPWFTGFDTLLFWIPVLLSFGMVTLGWIKNFPRWSYPYVAASLLFTVALCFSSPAGCLPLLFAVALALLVTRSTRPLFHLVDRGLQDWTVFAFGAFGTLPVWMEAWCDRAEPSYAYPWLIGLTLFMTGVALAYLRSPHFRGRSLVIKTGLILSGLVHIVGPAALYPVLLGHEIELGYVVLIVIVESILLFVLLSPVLLVKLFQYWTRLRAEGSL